MFGKLAKFRIVAQWLNAPLCRPVYSHPIHSNDNRPGFRRPGGQSLRPHQALACHWFLAPDGRHLECRWELASGDRSTCDRGRSPLSPTPHLLPAIGQVAAIEQIAS
jgi:hypothetical protein